MSIFSFCRSSALVRGCAASFVGAAALVGCGGGGSDDGASASAAGSTESNATGTGSTTAVANDSRAAPLASVTTNATPILACDASGIGNTRLVSDLPTLPTTTPPNDASATIASVSTGVTSGIPYCLVKVVVPPAINIWVGLPTGGNWNGRLQSEGGGGYAGSVGVPTGSIAAGYVGAQTDTGHVGGSGTFGMSTPVPNGAPDVQLQTDFAYRSEHEMAVIGKQLAQAFYGEAPRFSYWNGCSTGGRQGMRMAQQFPGDYHGILAGAPAFHWDRFQAYQIWPQVAMRLEAGGPVSSAKQTLATNAAIASCDAIDGVTDGVIGDPRQCTYNPVNDAAITKASCGSSDATCLSPGEASAIQKIWGGARNASGKLLWPGLERGATLSGLAGTTPFSIAVAQPRYWVYFDPAWDWTTLTYANYEGFFKQTMQMVNPLMASETPDLTAFRNGGGKIVMWQGWADQLIMPQGSTIYYDAATNYMGGGYAQTQQFFRHFMAPAVGHCGGGNGPQPQNLLQAVVDWVELGTVPTRIIASKALTGGATQTRPLCPYPAAAKYSGSGSTDDAANFVCVAP
ncbi:MAG: tannase/feruloyl esterase family alpha/beta hydrolase [Caldimonas sp.]